MAQIRKMAQGIQTLYPNSNIHKPQLPTFSSFFGSKKLKISAKSIWFLNKDSVLTTRSSYSSFGISASVATTKKPSEILLQPIREISGTVKLPGSKSLSHRILLLAALSQGTTVVDNLLSSDDIYYMLGALKILGLRVEDDSGNQRAVVEGCGGLFPVGKDSKEEIQLFLGNSGTAIRLLTAVLAVAGRNSRSNCIPSYNNNNIPSEIPQSGVWEG